MSTSFSPKDCAKCGACLVACPLYRQSGHEAHAARGKLHLLDVLGLDKSGPVFEEVFSKCLLCGACEAVCPRGIEIRQGVIRARESFSAIYGSHGYEKFLARKLLDHPLLLKGAGGVGQAASRLLRERLPTTSGLRLRLGLFAETASEAGFDFPGSDQEGGEELVCFPGCVSAALFPAILSATCRLVAAKDYRLSIPKGLGCCGLAALSAGDRPRAVELAKQNVEILEQGEGQILLPCASCYSQMQGMEQLLAREGGGWPERARAVARRMKELSTFLLQLFADRLEKSGQGSRPLRVFYHDPCHLRFGLKITKEPRQLLRLFPGIELVELADGPECCGQGGLFQIGSPELSGAIGSRVAARVLALNPDVITTSCSGCLMQWKTAMAAQANPVQVLHLSQLILRLSSL